MQRIKSAKLIKFFGTLLFILGLSLVIIAIVEGLILYHPLIIQEIQYDLKTFDSAEPTPPVDTDFGIVIPKIGVNSRVISNVDPFNPKEYQVELTKGVAHAKGSAYPGSIGNVFLFSHSSTDFDEAVKYNSIFYLLSKLEEGDTILLYYKNAEYKYEVSQKKVVAPEDIDYLEDISSTPIVTLMTCWPAGTDFRRLVVVGNLAQ